MINIYSEIISVSSTWRPWSFIILNIPWVSYLLSTYSIFLYFINGRRNILKKPMIPCTYQNYNLIYRTIRRIRIRYTEYKALRFIGYASTYKDFRIHIFTICRKLSFKQVIKSIFSYSGIIPPCAKSGIVILRGSVLHIYDYNYLNFIIFLYLIDYRISIKKLWRKIEIIKSKTLFGFCKCTHNWTLSNRLILHYLS
jgi:hypothetical protein